MKIALFITDTPTVSSSEIEAFIDLLRKGGYTPCIIFSGDDELKDVELGISIGGDGTFLRMARRMAQSGIPVVGVNAGHLGFLTQYGLNEGAQLIDDLQHKRLRIEERTLLKVECKEGMPDGIWPYALNEVSVLKTDTSSMLDTEVYEESELIADYLADGVLISTPTGSTAYSLAAGGPLLAPALNTMVIVPVAPHTLTLRPLVMPGESRLRLIPRSRAGKCRISIDGCSYSVATPTEIRVSNAPFRLKVYTRPDLNFFSTLRQKLHWAQR